ncbi:hypothetical protein [Pinibacter aurantiacus]|uniref:Ig-like domain-containing protein n=1 Tax=Pinibacter aurantiacus TaxID=2851599 RepID=A0A9E2S7X7_9BACT|nr:hypothetical protein [Pinibacter aurantiacus]MBV4357267.1 hypothetical protein [Pinibacter aurantiacus]
MKKNFKQLLFLLLLSSPLAGFSQLSNGGINAYFGIDGDTRGNYVKYGPLTGFISSDDWFSGIASGQNVVDTSNASYYRTVLSGGGNISFNKRMSVPLFSRVNGKLWLDAVYGRDYACTNPLFDSTVFASSAKNGDNPGNWGGTTSNIPNKTDLVDVFAHMRRDGSSVYDSLWLFVGASTVGTNGSRYFDIELYKDSFNYKGGTFISKGPDAGHTQWKFDAAGNITQTGDMILAVNFNPGAPPVVDTRIWVSNSTFTGTIPKYFDFGAVLDGSTAAFGYVSITSKAGTTNFGTGTSNYSTTATNDTTYSTPWGTQTSSAGWGTKYESLQLVEIGLNLTRIGVDPALYSALSPCQPMFTDLFFKSRSSNSFTSNMQDFVTPLPFVSLPIMDFTVQSDTLRCNRSAGGITITNHSTIGKYTWTTADGASITSSSTDGSQITLDKPGTYIVSGSPATGCPPTRIDTIVVPLDTFPPVASVYVGIGADLGHVQFFGGDPVASNYPTPFGGSDGLTWSWVGPNGFVSSLQNPINDTTWGNYKLVVTENRNGCIDTISQDVIRGMFTVMSNPNILLTGKYTNKAIAIKWDDKGSNYVDRYQIEKSADGISYMTVGVVSPASGINNQFSFTDAQPAYKTNWYRIKGIQKNGTAAYSNTLKIADGADSRFYLTRNSQSQNISLTCDVETDYNCNLLICNILGQVLVNKPVHLQKGLNTLEITSSAFQKNVVGVVVLLKNNAILFSDKVVF